MGCRIAHDSSSIAGAEQERPEFHALAMPRAGRGEIEHILLDGTRLPGMRLLRVYVPSPELRGEQPLPVVLVNDGHKAFEPANHDSVSPFEQSGTLQLHRVMDGLSCAGRVRPAVVVAVAVHASSRANQYVPIRTRFGDIPFGGNGDLYLDVLQHEVLAAVRARLRPLSISTAPADCVLLGTSIGAVSALYGAMTRPSVFGSAIALSPSAWVGDGFLTHMARQLGAVQARIAADIGDAERPTILGHCRELFAALSEQADDRVMATVVAGVHNEDSWRARLPRMLQHVLGPR